MKISKGRRVRVKVRLAIAGGDELEKSVVEYIHGSGTMLAGLEQTLDGLERGAKKAGVIKSEDAFGNESFQYQKHIARREFPDGDALKPGARFMAKGAGNQQDVVLEVVSIDADVVVVKFLHPLHDKDIEYDAEVVSVTDPIPPPLPAGVIGAKETDD